MSALLIFYRFIKNYQKDSGLFKSNTIHIVLPAQEEVGGREKVMSGVGKARSQKPGRERPLFAQHVDIL